MESTRYERQFVVWTHDPDADAYRAAGTMNFNVPIKTLGGKQYWGDERIFGGWRIQRHVWTGHFRLLDERDIRSAWGSCQQCEQALTNAIAAGKARQRSEKLCLLIHGYIRSKDSLRPLQTALAAEGYEVYAVNYPSMAKSIEDISAQVGRVLAHARQDFEQIDLVTHSLGGIIARTLLSGANADCRGKLVMLAPPNQGARLSEVLFGWWPSAWVAGPVSQQLKTGVDSFIAKAGIPSCPFGVIAGSTRGGLGMNPLIPGDDDGIVAVAETRLDGMVDFVVVPAIHTLIMNNPEVHRQVLHFLKHGAFHHPDPVSPPQRK